VNNIARQLIEVGLAEAMDYSHLRLDPALPSYLLGQMIATEREGLKSRWAEAMRALTAFLYQQRFQDTQLAHQLALLELPNLLALLAWAEAALMPEEVVGLAGRVETLLAPLGRPQGLAQATKVREAAAKALGEWGHAQFEAVRISIDRLLEQGKLPAAYAAAQQLLQRAFAAGAEAYPEYEEGIRRDEKLGDRRGAAVSKGNLGTVRLLQKRYAEALAIHAEARKTFESLGEPGGVAGSWHQIGIVHKNAGQFEQAEQAHQQALAIRVQHQLIADEAASLAELGNLYNQMGRLEEAATFFGQAAYIYAQLQDLRYEGVVRSNLADTLIKLQRFEEARRELRRAIECKKPFGHAAEPWKT
jgi:tetratricopeptide (TPR) repeat protein